MQLVSMTLKNYRSITHARKIGLAKNTVLIGPNNEGKSNILRALAVSMEVLSGLPEFKGHLRIGRRNYDWERDFPVHLQSSKPNGKSEIILEFALTDAEVAEFWDTIKSRLNGTLPINIFAWHVGCCRHQGCEAWSGGKGTE